MDEAAPASRYELLSPEWRQNSYPLYAWLRENAPAHWDERWGGWLLTRHADVAAALRDPRLSLGGGVSALFGRMPAERLHRFAYLRRHLDLWMGSLDTQDHIRVRRSFQEAFKPAALAALRAEMERDARRLIGDLLPRGRFDLVNDFAYPYSAITMAKFIGAPYDDWPKFRGWADALNQFLGCGFFTDEILERTQHTVIEMIGYFERLLLAPDGTRTGLMALIDTDMLTTEEILASCVVLLFGGYETTATLIGSCVLALAPDVATWVRLADDPDLRKAAVEETLRFDAPIQMVRRRAETDLDYGGGAIRAGEVVWLVLGAANRDPAAFDDPDTFAVARGAHRHIAFGFGSHLCVGAALARIEAAAALATLSRTIPALTVTDETIRWHNNPTSRSLATLTIATSPHAACPVT